MKDSSKVVWPLSVRAIHWSVAIIVFLNTFVIEEGDPPHRWLGYVALVAIVVRILQGIRGPKHVRFSDMPIRFSEIKDFLKYHFTDKSIDHIGHNPLASIVYLMMWFCIIALGISGWMMGLDAFWGNETLEIIHEKISDFLLVCVYVHLLGVAIDAILYKRKTWMAMIKGYK